MVKTESAAALRLRLVVTEHQEGMGRRMRARREALGLSRDEVARRMGAIAAENGDVDKTNGNAIYRYETGEVTPGPKKLDLLARALQTQVATFMLDEPEPGTPDLMGALNGDSQLDRIEQENQRIEAKLDALLEHFGVELAPETISEAVEKARGRLGGEGPPPDGTERRRRDRRAA